MPSRLSIGRSLVDRFRSGPSSRLMVDRPSDGVTQGRPHCLACRSTELRNVNLTHPKTGRTMTAVCCRSCRYVALPDNRRDYSKAVDAKGLGGSGGARMGTSDEPGREYGMAQLGLEVLARKNASVLVYGAGQSIDNHHIAKLRRAGRVAVGDLKPLRDDAECVNTSELSTDPFDVVVASEVLEHFPDPRRNFENLFSYVKDDGIIIASTNIRDQLPMRKVGYIWPIGHVSYWSPQSLRIIADEFDMHLDFRVPACATGGIGPRKRYVIFSRSRAVMNAVSDWFGSNMYAPSERPTLPRRGSSLHPVEHVQSDPLQSAPAVDAT